MKQLTHYLLVSLLIITTGCRCNDDDDILVEEEPDICETIAPLNADFSIYTEHSYVGFNAAQTADSTFTARLYYPDTFYSARVHFEAEDASARSYVWELGSDPEPRYGQNFSLPFLPEHAGPIDFTLITKREVLECPEFGEETATLTKSYHLMDPNTVTRIPNLGRYLGNDEGSDLPPFEIRIDKRFPDEDIYHPRYLYDFPRGTINSDEMDAIPIVGIRNFIFYVRGTIACCEETYGTATLSDNWQELRIEYRIRRNGKWEDSVWTGQRIVE